MQLPTSLSTAHGDVDPKAMQWDGKKILLFDSVGSGPLIACAAGRGYEVLIETELALGVRGVLIDRPSVVILDPYAHGMESFEHFKAIRAATTAPIVILSSHSDSIDRVLGLDTGADAYLVAPQEPRVVLAHVEALLRRSPKRPMPVRSEAALEVGAFAMNRLARVATYQGVHISLTSSDFELLWVLLLNHGAVIERRQLARLLRLGDAASDGRSLDGRAFRLRRALEEAGAPAGSLKALRGRGFVFIAEADGANLP